MLGSQLDLCTQKRLAAIQGTPQLICPDDLIRLRCTYASLNTEPEISVYGTERLRLPLTIDSETIQSKERLKNSTTDGAAIPSGHICIYVHSI